MDIIKPQHLEALLAIMYNALPKFNIDPKTIAEYADILKERTNDLKITGIKSDNKELFGNVAKIVNTAMLMQVLLIREGWGEGAAEKN